MTTTRMHIRRRGTVNKPREANVRATTFLINRGDTNTSRQIEAIDTFGGFVISGANGSILLPTPYNVGVLFDVIERSNMLPQCIEAYVTNIVHTGWEVDASVRGKETNAAESHELQSFIDHANVDESLTAIMDQVIRDRESVGFGFVEIIRDAVGEMGLWRYAPALHTRIASKHPQEVLVTTEIMRGRRITTVQEYKKFRKYLQIVNGEQRWFKEFGDPRRMNYQTGAFEGEPGWEEGREATEIKHFRLPSNETYGVPRWINQLPSIVGSREAEQVNMRYFQENTIPPMLLLVGNGRLSAHSYAELTRTLNEEGIGGERQNKILLLEAVGESDSMDGKSGTIDLKVERLTDTRQSDGLFKAYDEGNMAKVRSSFRLPPVLVGMSQDVNFATATTSVFVAESQVFAPERSKLDETLNQCFVNGKNGLALKTVKLTSRTPSITSPEMVVKTLTAVNVMGGLTPRSAQKITNKMMQLEIDEYPKRGEKGYEDWMDTPMPVTTANKKTQAEQSLKDDKTKEIEAEGEIIQQPKNGEQ